MLNWIYSNKSWLFDGIGVLIISIILNKILFSKNNRPLGIKYIIQKQKSGNNSPNFQADKINIYVTSSRQNEPEPSPGNKKFVIIIIIAAILGIFLISSMVSDNGNVVSSQSDAVNSSQLSDVNRGYFQEVKYESNAWENQKYFSVRVGDKHYVLLKPDSNKIAELVIDSGDEYILKTGDKLDFGQGYTLEAKQIDVDGKKVWLEFDKDGQYVDDSIISIGSGDGTWTCKVDNVQDEDDVPVLKVHVNRVYENASGTSIEIDGLWLINYANASIYTGNESNDIR